MGTRATDTLKEIEEIRSRLERSMDSLERKIPLARYGRRGAAILASSGVLGSLIAARSRKRRPEKAERRKKGDDRPAAAPIVVNVAPKGLTAVAAVGVAAWAGVRIFEVYSQQRAGGTADEGFRPAVVTKMPDPDQRSGAGS